LLRGLLPDGIAKTVLKHLAQFAGNTGGLTQVGFALLLVSALALLMSVEGTLNRIWQVKKPRPLLRRLGLYLGMLLTGPVLIGASLWAASYLATASSGLPDGTISIARRCGSAGCPTDVCSSEMLPAIGARTM